MTVIWRLGGVPGAVNPTDPEVQDPVEVVGMDEVDEDCIAPPVVAFMKFGTTG